MKKSNNVYIRISEFHNHECLCGCAVVRKSAMFVTKMLQTSKQNQELKLVLHKKKLSNNFIVKRFAKYHITRVIFICILYIYEGLFI